MFTFSAAGRKARDLARRRQRQPNLPCEVEHRHRQQHMGLSRSQRFAQHGSGRTHQLQAPVPVSALNASFSLSASHERGRGRSTPISSSTRPFDSTTTRLARKTASPTSWVMKMHGRALLLPDAGQLLLQGHARLRIDAGERLVHQQHVGLVGERPHHADALLHAARQLVGIAVRRLRQLGERQVLAGDLLALGLARCRASSARRRRCRARCATETARTTGTPRRGRGPDLSPAGRRAGSRRP